MAKFAKKMKGGAPAVSTASLPDIVFMLLFFFMVTTTMKEVEYKVAFTVPEASEVKKIENKSLVSYIYVGPPNQSWQSQYGTTPVIQLNDQISKIGMIQQYIEEERSQRSESDVPKMTYSLKIDENTDMGIVSDIKQELRIVQALKINYSARRVSPKQ
jgi:biopolymer transport protein ExbD